MHQFGSLFGVQAKLPAQIHFRLPSRFVESNPARAKAYFPNWVRRILGIVWFVMAAAAAYFGVVELGIPKVLSGKQDDLIFGIIVMIIITPITTAGLFLFGRYSWQGEYDE